MTDDRRRMLTEEVLGECWHGYTDGVTSDGQWRMCTCGYAYIIPEKHRNRTFATWKDLGDLKEKIVEMGEWESFLIYAASTFSPDREMKNFTNYLLDPTRFSELVARWWEERKVKEGEGMICPICGRLLKPVVIMWNECEELRWNSKHDYFCPCCGATVNIEDKDGSQCHTLKEGR